MSLKVISLSYLLVCSETEKTTSRGFLCSQPVGIDGNILFKTKHTVLKPPYLILRQAVQCNPFINRRDQLRGKNEVGYQHECRADPSAEPAGLHEGQPDTSVDPDTSSIPSRLVLLLSYLSVSKLYLYRGLN